MNTLSARRVSHEWSTRKWSRFMTLSRTRPPGLRDVTGMQSCPDNSLSLSRWQTPPRRGVTDARVDTSMPLPDKDGLRGWHCRPEKRTDINTAPFPISRRWSKSLFLVAEGHLLALCRKWSKTVMLKHRQNKKKKGTLIFKYFTETLIEI